MTVAGSKSGSTARRQNMPSADDHEGSRHGRDVERRARCGPRPACSGTASRSSRRCSGRCAGRSRRCAGCASIPGRSRCTCGGCRPAPRGSTARPAPAAPRRKSGAVGERIEPLGELGPVALGDAGDQRFLAVEIDVERAGADARLLADVVHGGAVEAGAGKAAARRRRGCARGAACWTSGLSLGIAGVPPASCSPHPGAPGCSGSQCDPQFCSHCTKQNEQPFYLRGTRRSQGKGAGG